MKAVPLVAVLIAAPAAARSPFEGRTLTIAGTDPETGHTFRIAEHRK